jgi:tetratricopeptide (TPR) repeat protein
MISSQVEVEELVPSEDLYYHTQINKIAWQVIPEFDRAAKAFVFFHLLFISLIGLEVFSLFLFSANLIHSSVFAFCLAGIVLSIFAYLLLKIPMRERKKSRMEGIRSEFVGICKKLLHFEEGVAEHHLTLSQAYCLLETRLQNREGRYYAPPAFLDLVAPQIKALSESLHFFDVHSFREELLKGAIEEHITLVKLEPTSLQMHAALANAYVRLSGIYTERESETFAEKFRQTAKRAIEEFKILNDFAPDEPWVHAQLAYSYRDLQMPQEEIRELEMILTLRPNDKETLYKLGILYFQQGANAKGLLVYQRLKRLHENLAVRLIEHYGDF